jgi:hypothetical protein
MRPGRQFGAVLTGLFLIAWATTYNAAVMCGDDVNHFHAVYGNNMYLPNFSWDWIPNRVFDLYVRHLVAALFDAIYFPVHTLTGVGFFGFYKFFSATMFTLFICGVYGYLRAALPVGAGGLAHALLLDVTLALAVLLVLPWTNQVRMLCYELPAFLSFVVLVELGQSFLHAARPMARAKPRLAPASLLLLSFVVAFSLEAYAAIMLVVLLTGCLSVAALASRAALRAEIWEFLRRPEMRPGIIVSSGLVIFSILALLTTILFSERSADVHRHQPLSGLHFNLPGMRGFSFNASLCGSLLVAGILLLMGIVLAGRYFGPVSRLVKRLPIDDKSGVMAALFVLLLAATLIVVALISFQADQNYFDFASYPWGGLTLILQLMSLLVVGLVLVPSGGQSFWLASLRMFILFVLASRIAIAVLGGQAAAAEKSDLVAAAYAQVTGGATGMVQTGLSLDAMPMQARPLPTMDSPGWFIRNYHDFFEKYYGVNFQGSFE